MSARLLRKVLREQEQNQKQAFDHQDEDESDESDSGGHSINPFDLLNANEEDQDADKDDEAGSADDTLGEKSCEQRLPASESTISRGQSSYKRTKKKKKKKSKEVSSTVAGRAEKSFDLDLETLSLRDDSTETQACSSKASTANFRLGDNFGKQQNPSILKVDPKFLKAENELRRIFGSKVVNSFENTNQTGSSRQVRGGRRGGFGHRKSILVSPSEHWPRWDGSLSMELLETKNGSHYFRYVTSPSYSEAHRALEAAKAIHDLNGVASILMYHPYHVGSLMMLADYFKFIGEHQMAADAVAKCLYALECAWHPMFTPLQGNCRLEYSHEVNRTLFSALSMHMRNLDRRGCHRSALEVCKLLLSLDSVDPMGALLCIDYFSLRAEEYAWLEQFSEEYLTHSFLWHFPNFAYSLAICRFYLEQREASQSSAENRKDTSVELMKQALLMHPPVLKKLVEKVPLKDQAWTNILKHACFKLEETKSPSLDHLIRIYVERSYLVWRLPDLQKLLKNAATLVIETLKEDASVANTWACVRKEAFPSEKNEYKHLLVSDFSDAAPTMPPDNLQNFVMADPAMRGMAHNQDLGANQQIHAHRDLVDRSLLAVLVESILPWVYYQDDEAGNGHHQENEH